jgi:hypothetical protein
MVNPCTCACVIEFESRASRPMEGYEAQETLRRTVIDASSVRPGPTL